MMKNVVVMALAMVVSVSANAGLFGSDDTSSSVNKTDARAMNKVLKGTVLQVTDAKIEASKGADGVGVMAGAGIGGAVGSNVSKHGLIGGLIGAAVGGIAGVATTAIAGEQKAQDIIIQTDTGEMTSITQAVDDKVGAFVEGDNVLIIYKGTSARVIRNKMNAAFKAASPAETVQ